MKQEEALRLVAEFLKTHGLDGSQPPDDASAEQSTEEGKGQDLFAGGDPSLAFRYFPDSGELKCYALIYQFSDEPRTGILEACREEAGHAEMGGGELEYDPSDKGLYLTKVYSGPVPVSQLTTDLGKLHEAGVVWGEEVMDRVASKVFGPGKPGK